MNKNVIRLSFMPGAGGNFLSRCLNLHPDINCFKECIGANYEKKYNILNYKKIQPRSPRTDNWVEFEEFINYFTDDNFKETSKIKNVIIFTHTESEFEQVTLNYSCDIRITNYSNEELDWAIFNGLYKNSTPNTKHYLKIGRLYDQKISVPCKNLWNFDLLCDNLIEIEDYLNIEKNIEECRLWQKQLWNEWKLTWASEKFKNKVINKFKKN